MRRDMGSARRTPNVDGINRRGPQCVQINSAASMPAIAKLPPGRPERAVDDPMSAAFWPGTRDAMKFAAARAIQISRDMGHSNLVIGSRSHR